MKRSFRSDTAGISTVIGVVLIVGITVVLMGVIGGFVLNSGPGTQSPNADFAMTELESGGDIELDLRYADGPDLVLKENVDVTVDGDPACDGTSSVDWNTDSGAFELGDSIVVDGYGTSCGSPSDLTSGDVVRVTWISDDGTTSKILASYEIKG